MIIPLGGLDELHLGVSPVGRELELRELLDSVRCCLVVVQGYQLVEGVDLISCSYGAATPLILLVFEVSHVNVSIVVDRCACISACLRRIPLPRLLPSGLRECSTGLLLQGHNGLGLHGVHTVPL